MAKIRSGQGAGITFDAVRKLAGLEGIALVLAEGLPPIPIDIGYRNGTSTPTAEYLIEALKVEAERSAMGSPNR